MSTALELVYQYRQLAGKCEPGGQGLSFEEIDLMSAIGALFSFRDVRRRPAPMCRRAFQRERVDLPAVLRGRGNHDEVRVVDLGLGGVVCINAPYLDPGDRVELVFDDPECLLSYRFKAEVVWVEEDALGELSCGLRFVGAPLLLRRRPATQRFRFARAA